MNLSGATVYLMTRTTLISISGLNVAAWYASQVGKIPLSNSPYSVHSDTFIKVDRPTVYTDVSASRSGIVDLDTVEPLQAGITPRARHTINIIIYTVVNTFNLKPM